MFISDVLFYDTSLYLLANQPLPADIPGYQGTIRPTLQHVGNILKILGLDNIFIRDMNSYTLAMVRT
ncbi:MAG: hypothetical protein APF77_08875 [Clostridia bacterium BRH_c25]|nr:MAG: hypothetical protein APF77_08875 [Clostridia bacterium BRH_c25]